MRIISIGDLVLDYYYKDSKLKGINGGMSSHNIIANLSKMNKKTAVYGACGNDIQGEIAMKSLNELGVNTDNVTVIDGIDTRCFHVSYLMENEKVTFTSKKRCPFCNQKKWYDESKIDENNIKKTLMDDDILVFDNLNIKNQTIIDNCKNRKMLDLGQYFELENYTEKEIFEKLKNKFDIINLNERVEKYLLKRLSLTDAREIYNHIRPELLIVTRGNKGTDFVFNGKIINKKILNPSKELDSTGAGDAFFSVIIKESIDNNFKIDEKFIDKSFDKATKLTKKVVKKFSARGHIQPLYKTKKIKNMCSCQKFELSVRKQIKRCNININNLETRVLNAINSNAYQKLREINFDKINNALFIGTGGSYSCAKLSSKIINNIYDTNTQALLPRDVYYRNNKKIDKAFLFTYSGTTNDLLVGTSDISDENKYIITKGQTQKVVTKMNVPKSNIISYRTINNKASERGFLAFEGVLSPASLFLKLYFEKNDNRNIDEFIDECIQYWKTFFQEYFKKNKKILKEILKKGNQFNIFSGDFTEAAALDLESKIIESGIFNCLIHEKKNFSHGRFINYEHVNCKINIYLKQKDINTYEERLLEYLNDDFNIVLESRYDDILCEYDLLVASQYLIYYISNFLNIDISKPTYSEKALKIYFYKGKL